MLVGLMLVLTSVRAAPLVSFVLQARAAALESQCESASRHGASRRSRHAAHPSHLAAAVASQSESPDFKGIPDAQKGMGWLFYVMLLFTILGFCICGCMMRLDPQTGHAKAGAAQPRPAAAGGAQAGYGGGAKKPAAKVSLPPAPAQPSLTRGGCGGGSLVCRGAPYLQTDRPIPSASKTRQGVARRRFAVSLC